MAVVEAPLCRAALNQASYKWPNRNKESDGIVSSDAHKKQNPNSDHDFGNAVDLTHDPANGCDAHAWARYLARMNFPWVKYVISNGQIWSRARASEGWRPYIGSNPHQKHVHVSIYERYRNTVQTWFPERTVEQTMAKLDKEDLDNIQRIVDAEVNEIYWLLLGVPKDTPRSERPTLKKISDTVSRRS